MTLNRENKSTSSQQQVPFSNQTTSVGKSRRDPQEDTDPFLFCVFPVPCLVSIPRQSPPSFASHTLRIKVWETMQQSGEVAGRLSGGVRLTPRWDNGSGGVGGFDHSSKPGG